MSDDNKKKTDFVDSTEYDPGVSDYLDYLLNLEEKMNEKKAEETPKKPEVKESKENLEKKPETKVVAKRTEKMKRAASKKLADSKKSANEEKNGKKNIKRKLEDEVCFSLCYPKPPKYAKNLSINRKSSMIFSLCNHCLMRTQAKKPINGLDGTAYLTLVLCSQFIDSNSKSRILNVN